MQTNGDGKIDDGYPASISAWGFPDDRLPDAGLQYFNRRTYFFFGSEYYKYNDNNIKVNHAILWMSIDYKELACNEIMRGP